MHNNQLCKWTMTYIIIWKPSKFGETDRNINFCQKNQFIPLFVTKFHVLLNVAFIDFQCCCRRRTRTNWCTSNIVHDILKIYSNIFHYILDCNNNNSTPSSSNRFSVDVGEISILRFLLISGSPSCNLIELDRFKNLAQLGPHLYSSVQITLLQKSARNWVQCFLKYF